MLVSVEVLHDPYPTGSKSMLTSVCVARCSEPADSEGPPSTIPDPYGYDYNAYEILYRSQDSDLLRPSRYVGPLSAILQRLPEGYGVVKVENVIAPRTAKAFCDTWEEYRRTCSDPAGREPLTLFHGTHEGHIGSIGTSALCVDHFFGVRLSLIAHVGTRTSRPLLAVVFFATPRYVIAQCPRVCWCRVKAACKC